MVTYSSVCTTGAGREEWQATSTVVELLTPLLHIYPCCVYSEESQREEEEEEEEEGKERGA